MQRTCFELAMVVGLLGVVPGAWAVNKCTGKDGAVVYQDAPCTNAAATAEKLKTWGNTPGAYQASAGRERAPDLRLKGPPQAASMLALYRRWVDAEQLALSTGRIALAGPVSTLQQLQREAEDLGMPPCLAGPQQTLVDLTAKTSIALIRFMQKDELTGMVYQLIDRSKLIDQFEQGVKDAKCG